MESAAKRRLIWKGCHFRSVGRRPPRSVVVCAQRCGWREQDGRSEATRVCGCVGTRVREPGVIKAGRRVRELACNSHKGQRDGAASQRQRRNGGWARTLKKSWASAPLFRRNLAAAGWFENTAACSAVYSPCAPAAGRISGVGGRPCDMCAVCEGGGRRAWRGLRVQASVRVAAPCERESQVVVR